MEEGKRIVHQRLRVCEERSAATHKGYPRVLKGDGGRKNRGRRGGWSSQTYHDTPACGNTLDMAPCAHIAYSYCSLMALLNVLIRVIEVVNCELGFLEEDMWGQVKLIFRSAE